MTKTWTKTTSWAGESRTLTFVFVKKNPLCLYLFFFFICKQIQPQCGRHHSVSVHRPGEWSVISDTACDPLLYSPTLTLEVRVSVSVVHLKRREVWTRASDFRVGPSVVL